MVSPLERFGHWLRTPYAALFAFVLIGVVTALGFYQLEREAAIRAHQLEREAVTRAQLLEQEALVRARENCTSNDFNRDIIQLMLRHAYEVSGDPYWKELLEPAREGPSLCQLLDVKPNPPPSVGTLPTPPPRAERGRSDPLTSPD